MGIEQLDYATILADLEAKRAALEATISSLITQPLARSVSQPS